MARRRLIRTWFGGYEERVRFFLGLLVFVLASANTANFILLRSAWLSLWDSVEESVEVRGRMASSALLREFQETQVRGSSPLAVPPAALNTIAQSAGCLSLSVVDALGRVVVSTDGSPEGSADRDFPHGVNLTPPPPGGISFRPAARILDRGGLMIRYQAVAGPGDGKVYLVKSVNDTADLDATGRGYRLLIWTQTLAIVAVLAAVLAFGRWIARPYRLMAEEAGAAALLEGRSDPEEIVAAFRRVMKKVRDQDEELRALHLEARAGGASLGRFTGEVASGMTSGLITLDALGRFAAANPAAGRILGWPSPPAPGAPLEEWAGAGSALARLIRASLAGDPSKSREEIEYVPRDPAARTLYLGVSISPILRQGGDDPDRSAGGLAAVEGAVCLIADLTEVRELEDRVRRREQLAGLGIVSAGIAHEIRNGLSTILGFARLSEKCTTPPARDHAQAIEREVQAMSGTVEEFLRFARPSRLVFAPVPLKPLLDQVVEEAAHAGLLDRMNVSVEGEGATISGDELALRQAFANLVRNASESADRPLSLRIAAFRSGRAAIVTFADDGDGIPPEHLDRIFVPFFTTRGKGTGIGLALAQKTILEHEGTIEVICPEGGGTEFRVRLPVSG